MRTLAAFVIGVVFGTGIALSGMIDPAKVLNFFDPFGTWDPSLALVMGGALLVAAPGYRLALRRPAPILCDRFALPTAREIDLKLVGGSALFGIGWGVTGFCPGGALPALGTFRLDVAVFVAALAAGLLLTRMVVARPQARRDAAAPKPV